MTTLGIVGSWLTRSSSAKRAASPEGIAIAAAPMEVPAAPSWRPEPLHRRHLRREHISVCEVPSRKSLRLQCEAGELWITTPQGEDLIVRAGEVCPRVGAGTVIVQALEDSIYHWGIS
ncbi:hypothetical protein DB346_20765 [Verrucomicrobia bacterium LW23]|nr:hypothetical protein DB346_20765 [Verrucomicrobia bacterium LW23]